MAGEYGVEGTEHDQRYTISPKECQAMQLLWDDDWDASTLAMVFEIDRANVYNHARGECDHREGNW